MLLRVAADRAAPPLVFEARAEHGQLVQHLVGTPVEHVVWLQRTLRHLLLDWILTGWTAHAYRESGRCGSVSDPAHSLIHRAGRGHQPESAVRSGCPPEGGRAAGRAGHARTAGHAQAPAQGDPGSHPAAVAGRNPGGGISGQASTGPDRYQVRPTRIRRSGPYRTWSLRTWLAAGRPVLVIDPKWQLIRDIIERAIPKKRIDDVVIIDPAEATTGRSSASTPYLQGTRQIQLGEHPAHASDPRYRPAHYRRSGGLPEPVHPPRLGPGPRR